MNRHLLLSFLLLLCASINLCAQPANHLDLIQTMTGEFDGSEFGSSMASLDFNGDGYMDLVVASQAWNPTGVFNDNNRWGKLYFYWGGPAGLSATPDFTIPGTYNWQYGGTFGGFQIFNAGDVNGDSIADLVCAGRSTSGIYQALVFYGRSEPLAVPDRVYEFPSAAGGYIEVYPLGDINHDNHSDLSICIMGSTSYNYIYLWTDINASPWLFRKTNNQSDWIFMGRIGDVNGDGIDDCFMRLPINGMGTNHCRLVAYYGSAAFPATDSLIITEDTNAVTYWWGSPVGDVNGDGIDDFVAYNSQIRLGGSCLWLGDTNLTPTWDMLLIPVDDYVEEHSGLPYVHGDLNNDGYEDIIAATATYGYYSGRVFIWMGRSQMNGTVDMNLPPPTNYQNRNFGWAKVMGDFDNNGYCDLAVSAPWWADGGSFLFPGNVFIYSGNADLHDTTVANEDEILPATNHWAVDIYPNPFNPNTTITFSLPKVMKTKVRIYNLKGQFMRELCNSICKKGQQKLVWDGKDTNRKEVASGIYFIRLQAGGRTTTRKAMLIK